MKIFAFHSGFNGVAMYRVWQPMKYLAKLPGFTVKGLPLRSERVKWEGLTGPCNVPGIGSHASIIENNDVIFTTFKASEEDCARLYATAQVKKLVIDIDDDILSLPTDNPNYKFWFNEDNGKDVWAEIPEDEEGDEKWPALATQYGARLERHPKTGRLCMVQVRRHPCEIVLDELSKAHLVTVSTEVMRRKYCAYNPNTVVIPNGIDFDNFPVLLEPKKDGLIRLGLFGSNSHYRDWKTIAKALKALLDEFPNLRLCYNTWYRATGAAGSSMDEQEKVLLFPDFFDKLGLREHPQVEVFAGVEIDDYFDWLRDKRVDIGLAPLCDSEFNRAKSNIKYLEFSALHIPGVYQDMEPYNGDVRPGINGFLANGTDEWLKCIRRLVVDADLRQRMGDSAYADVKARYNQADISARLAKILMAFEKDGTYEENTASERPDIVVCAG
jgi:hypothetical protein